MEGAENEIDQEDFVSYEKQLNDEGDADADEMEQWQQKMTERNHQSLKNILYGLRNEDAESSVFEVFKASTISILLASFLGLWPFLPIIITGNEEVSVEEFSDNFNIGMYFISLFFFGMISTAPTVVFGDRIILHDVCEQNAPKWVLVATCASAGLAGAIFTCSTSLVFDWRPVPFGFLFCFQGFWITGFMVFIGYVYQSKFYANASALCKKEMYNRCLIWIVLNLSLSTGFLVYLSMYITKINIGSYSEELWFTIVYIIALFILKEINGTIIEKIYTYLLGEKFYIHLGQQWTLTLHAFFLAIVLGSSEGEGDEDNDNNSYQVIFVVCIDVGMCIVKIATLCWSNAKIEDELAQLDLDTKLNLINVEEAAKGPHMESNGSEEKYNVPDVSDPNAIVDPNAMAKAKELAQDIEAEAEKRRQSRPPQQNQQQQPARAQSARARARSRSRQSSIGFSRDGRKSISHSYNARKKNTVKLFIANATHEMSFGKGRRLSDQIVTRNHGILKDALYLTLSELTELIVPLVVLITTIIIFLLPSKYWIGNIGKGADVWGYHHIRDLGFVAQNIGIWVFVEFLTYSFVVGTVQYAYGLNLSAALSQYMKEVGVITSFIIVSLVINFWGFLYLPYGCNPNFEFVWLN